MTESTATGSPNRSGARRRRGIAGGLAVLVVALGAAILIAAVGLRRPVPEPKPMALTDILARAIAIDGMDAAVVRYRSLREQGFPGLYESESETNKLGYALLRQGANEHAIQVFRLNVETHPQSANVYDSLGEAYLAAGNRALAIENYQRAVAMNPRAKLSITALRRLTNSKRAPYPLIVLFHICAGSLGLLSGAVAMSLRKGSRQHGVAGNVFCVSMLSMSASGAYVAFVAPDGEVINVLMGVLTFYLVATAWLAAKRRSGKPGIFDRAALLVALAVAAGLANYGFEAASSRAGTKDGIASGLYFAFGAVALLAAALDVRMIASGGVLGAQRVARHLWRMCCALFIAVTSLFLGQPQVFPDSLRNSGVLVVPGILVVIVMVFWLIRVLFTKAYKRTVSSKSEMLVGRAAT